MDTCSQHGELCKQVSEIHNAILGTVDDKPGLMERIRKIEAFISGTKFWGRTILVLTLTNLAALFFQLLKGLLN